MLTLYIIEAISVVTLVLAYFVIPERIQKKQLPINQEFIDREDAGGSLITLNGIGSRFVGKFRFDKESGIYVTYRMATLFYAPILPLGCYVVKNVSDFLDGKYEVYGSIKANRWELLQLYLRWYGWIVFAINSFLMLTSFAY